MFHNSFFDLISRGDHDLVQSLSDGRTLGLTKFFAAVTNLGGVRFLALFFLLAIIFLIYLAKRKDLILPFIITIIGSVGTTAALKYLIGRSRPDELFRAIVESGPSMPSAHATVAMALYGFFVYFAFKESTNTFYRVVIVTFGIIFMTLIGFSRVYLGVHYPSDVLAGFVVGFVWLFIGVHLKHRSTL